MVLDLANAFFAVGRCIVFLFNGDIFAQRKNKYYYRYMYCNQYSCVNFRCRDYLFLYTYFVKGECDDMRKYLCVFLALLIMCVAPVSVSATEVSENTSLDEIYANAYLSAAELDAENVSDDISAYAYIVQNENKVNIVENQLVVNGSELNNSENVVLQNFVSRLNVLLEKNAIRIDSNFRIYVKDAPSTEIIATRVAVFNLMEIARENAAELKEVYDNAVFGTATITAGLYFTERVKSGGAWDFKRPLGTNTTYYVPDLEAYMTGETIGNFHYGYVGSAVFGPGVLKTAAGLYQIVSGTSDWSYWDSYFDDPADTEDIQWGIDVYNREN